MTVTTAARLVSASVSFLIPLVSCTSTQQQDRTTVEAHIVNVENGLLPPILVEGDRGWNILERMEKYEVPGVSIAVIHDFEIVWAKGYGVKDITTNEPVTENTMFQAASLGKSLNATAIMKKVQDGNLSLDADVNDYLHSWQIPDNEFTTEKMVTLANLLSHTGGTTVRSFQGYREGESIPTIQQMLRGEFPASNAPVVVDMEPGKAYRYSGGGTIISQLVLMELENKPYQQIMEELLFIPLDMTNSTFAQPLPGALTARAASGHTGGRRLEGRFFTYPDLAAAGLWSTPSDLAKFVIEHQLSALGRSNKILTTEMEVKMMTPYISQDYGLGFSIYGKEGTYFEHSGGNRGFASIFFAHKTKGYGAVVMINSPAFDLISEILRAIAREYKWEDYLPVPYEIVTVAPADLQRYEGRYLINDDNVVRVNETNGRLYAERLGYGIAEIFPISDSDFISKTEDIRFIFKKGADIERDVMEIVSGGKSIVAPRISRERMVPHEYLVAGEIGKAIESYKSIQRSDPLSPLIEYRRIYGLAETFWIHGNQDAAIALLVVNTELYPDSANGFAELADAYLMIGNRDLAIESYEKILEMDPQNMNAIEKLRMLREEP